jgi:glucose-6-phosphate 1-dehydrogenase
MIQNHLLQVLCLIAMEPPVSFDAQEIRNKKVDVLHALRPILPDQVAHCAVRGQYGPGQMEGQPVPGYRQEPNVSPQSSTETYAAVKFWVDNWRWQDVPFYVRTGKRLAKRDSEIIIQFRPVPHQTFPASALSEWRPNHLALHVQPDEGIVLHFQVKRPGPALHLTPADMCFTYRDAFPIAPPEAYETLLEDVLQGDATLFMRADQVEAAWSVVMPILDAWQASPPVDFPNYAAGTWGPTAAETLLARAGHQWRIPVQV